MKLKVATIFSGGFLNTAKAGFVPLAAGAEWALKYSNISHEVVFACEIDKFARRLYLANHTCKTFYEDVTKLDAKPYKDKIDLLIGGFLVRLFLLQVKDETLKSFIAHKERMEKQGNGFKFKPKNIKAIASCINTGYGNKQTDTYVKLKRIGNIDQMGAKTGLYVVPRENNLIEDKQYRIRKLTPRECFRLMGDVEDRVKFVDLSPTQLYKNAGNGMEINVLRAIIERIEK